ncbi:MULTISPECIES: MBL fold metallo-hydrolase [Pseudanabaena]|uniref:Zn-dependent hydrolase of the beta-lactamase fold, putative n=2 Tax=Pseudanabaena TaxID=1152 RepID=L8N7N0_9CYAN|nr:MULTISPECIES: MBL fold metallo-hydrolase [Pseudanabaena]ELS34243.1 Zn-dependent hydrolase of the beta-lactamase fold, putative [Pseudanabaena biceps PCC 7429]MDG3493540.1 MBL fold metallo-hydrolase [Pseudanabaena catenata USMAC16]
MRRRQILRLAQGGLISAFTAGIIADAANSQANSTLRLQWLGHLSFLISGDNVSFLTHPFRPVGCTAKLTSPTAQSDYILISSRLLDEGYLENLPKDKRVLSEAGSYNLKGINLQGITMDHDRLGGRRFGRNVAWRWKQSGIFILHLGSAAAPITASQRILMGRPDVLILPIGGSAQSTDPMQAKAYSPQEAQAIVTELNPRIVIPVYYRTDKSSKSCQLASIDEFLALMPKDSIKKLEGSTLELNASSLPQSTVVRVLSS